MRNGVLWITWTLLTLAAAAWLGLPLLESWQAEGSTDMDRSMFLIGETSDGHHQIELACESCHTSAFGGQELLQDACENCHLDELNAVRDAHPKRKFTDPSNADRVALLDARFCVTCHREHKPEITEAMGVTVPEDVCFLCHEDIGDDRATHKDLAFDTCASSGCHNFHDNRALFEDFLVQNHGQPDVSEHPLVAPLNAIEQALMAGGGLQPDQANAPTSLADEGAIREWSATSHALAGVNCDGCHQQENGAWTERVALDQCQGCHEDQSEGFLLGKHGMRIAAGLTPMDPAMARLSMHESAHGRELSCASCHGAHEFNRQIAAVDACLGCHNSDHVTAYDASPHARLTERAFSGAASEESAVTCATCHMPRETSLVAGSGVTRVQHNQNANLRPSEKMLRSVCMNCHSLGFAMDALADTALVENNFTGRPSVHVESIDMAVKRRQGIIGRDDTYR